MILEAPHIEIDALYHGPDWTPRESFLADVHALVQRDAWVTEWQYSTARPILVKRAALVVWLDLPFLTVSLPRVVGRTLKRRMRREVLWNGNVEPALSSFFTDREHIVRWAWATRNKYGARISQLETDHPQLPIVRLRSRSEVESWLSGSLLQATRFRTAPPDGKVADMRIAEWWPQLDSDSQAWLIAHNGEALAPDVISKIVTVAGSVWEVGGSGPDGVFLTDEAVDWIETTANDESP